MSLVKMCGQPAAVTYDKFNFNNIVFNKMNVVIPKSESS